MQRWRPTIALAAMVFLCGCAGTMNSVSDYLRTGPWWPAAQAGDIRERARDLEAQGELAMSVDHWRTIERIAMDRAEAGSEIARLEDKITAAVQSHYQKGLAHLRKKKMAAARNHFLAALRLNPGFQPALRQIKSRYSPFPIAVYLSASGDRPATVAKKVFGDSEKAFLVAWFNNLPEDKTLTPGTLLILPKLDKIPAKKVRKKKPPNRLAEAGARLAENDLDGALALAEQANKGDSRTQALIDTIHLKKASVQIETGLLEDARLSLAMVPDGFAGKDAAIEKLQTTLKGRQAALDLAAARVHFDHGRYQQSIDQINAVLEVSPDNGEAHDLAAEARYRLALDHFDHQRFLKAREALANADEKHEASMALKETVHTRLRELAQIHYRNGVKDFINEDLKSAIAEWEMALACNPDHDNARKNIDNARRLLDKIESMP
jgi:tetratricopeptide (TPR) repeat protein